MARKPKKRGVKPGTKRGPYKRVSKTATITAVHGNTMQVGDIVSFDTLTPAEPVKSRTFADCIFEIINSNMEQSAKMAAFKAMEEAAKTEVVKHY